MRRFIIFILLSGLCLGDTFTSSLKPKDTHCSNIDLGTLACQWGDTWGDGTLSWDTITDDVFSITGGVGTGLVSLTDGTASWSSSSLSGFTSISGTTLTDTVLSINAGSITSAVNGTFSGTLTAEQLTSTDDATITDDLTVGGTGTFGQIIDSGLTASLGVYTDGSKQLTSTPPTSGVLGYWSRAGTVISTATAGDDISTTGLVTAGEFNTTGSVGNTGTLASFGVDGTAAAAFLGLIEIAAIGSGKEIGASLNAGLSIDIDRDIATVVSSQNNAALFAFNQPAGVQTNSSNEYGVFGATNATITAKQAFTGATTILRGLSFLANNNEDWVRTGAGASKRTIVTMGAEVKGELSAVGKIISGDDVVGINYGLNAIAIMLGSYDATGDAGKNYGVYAETRETSFTIGIGAVVDSYAVYIDAVAESAPTVNGTFNSWSLYSANDVDSFIKGDLGFGQTNMAERIASDADGTLDLYAGTRVNFGTPGTTELSVEADGDTFWVGDGTGLPYACMYVDGTQAIEVALTSGVIAEVKDDGTTSLDDGWLAGDLNLITFPTGGDEHYLSITKAGFYRVQWSLSFNTANPGANVEIHGGIAVDGTAIRNKAEAHRTIANNSDTGNMSGTAMIEAPNGTEQISVWLLNTTNNADVTVEHGNMSMVMVGGT